MTILYWIFFIALVGSVLYIFRRKISAFLMGLFWKP